MSINYISNSAEDTVNFAKKLANGDLEGIPPRSIILLIGEVGAGKTTFVRGFVSQWGIEDMVSSPTFTIINEYRYDRLRILHIDLYRLSETREALEIGLEEEISSCDYTFIEWPDIIMPLLNFTFITIQIKSGEDENQRIITIDKSNK